MMTAAERENQVLEVRNNRDLSVFDIVSIDDLTLEDIDLILDTAEVFKQAKTEKLSLCKGVTSVNAFFENSTRTRVSFEMAGKHLGIDTINISGGGSSTKKGESLIDTIETLASYHPKVIVVRSEHSGIPAQLAKVSKASVINAGDGWHEHPSQAMLDLKTIRDHFGKKLEGKTITIVGDALHSRVFGSVARLLKKVGMTVRIACPRTFLPEKVEEVFGVEHYDNIEEAVKDVDVVYALRVQEERGSKGYIPSLREYSKTFGITRKRLDLAKKDAILLDAGPVIRDITMHSQLVTEDAQSRILSQVENGMAIRAAMQYLLCARIDGKQKTFKLI